MFLKEDPDLEKRIYNTFKRGSRTYFYSTLFFPSNIREDVFKLYSFVREADDYVDQVPQNEDGFYSFRDKYRSALKGNPTGDVVIDSFIELSKRKRFEPQWADSFLKSMEMDLHKNTYATLKELRPYLYGSAEVIGLFMSRIMDLPTAAYNYAMSLGRAMQYINFIRDINEDLRLGRTYLPTEEVKDFCLDSLERNEAMSKPKEFKNFISFQIERYTKWQKEAEEGFIYIPKKHLLPIKTASDMYAFTAKVITSTPLIVYSQKVKPSIPRIIVSFARNKLSVRGRYVSSDLPLITLTGINKGV